jgi:hypothetical protein
MIRTTTDSDQSPPTGAGENVPFSALDEERQASMADEGGVSGALMEVDGEERTPNAHLARRILSVSWKLALGFALLGFAGVLIARTYPSR